MNINYYITPRGTIHISIGIVSPNNAGQQQL